MTSLLERIYDHNSLNMKLNDYYEGCLMLTCRDEYALADRVLLLYEINKKKRCCKNEIEVHMCTHISKLGK